MSEGRKSFVGVGKEVTFGTPVAVTDYQRFRRESLVRDIEEVTPPDIIAQYDEGPTYEGLNTFPGDVEFSAYPNVLGFWLLSAIGPVTTVVSEASVRWQHTFAFRQSEFSADCALQPLTLEIGRDLTTSFQLAGSIVNVMEMRFGIGAKVLEATASVMAKQQARITATTPSPESTKAFLWRQAAITLPDPTVFNRLTDLRFRVENNQEGMPYLDGTDTITRFRPGDRSRVITISGTHLASNAEVTEFENQTERFLKVVFTGETLGAGNFKLTLEFPKFRYTAYPVGVSGPGEIMVGFTGKAKFDPGVANTPGRVILENSKAAY